MKSDSSVTGNTPPADTATPKSEPFYKLTGSELKQFYKAKLIDAPLYVLLIVKTQRASGWKWTFKVRSFCKEWGIPERTFYRVVSKLKTLDLLHFEVGDSITVWHGTDIATGDIGTNTLSSVAVTVPSVAVTVPSVAVTVPSVAVTVPSVAQQTPETLAQSAPPGASDSYQIYSEFLKTLSDSEREIFLEFGRKKARELPKPPSLPDKWVAANWEELRSQWEQTKEGSAAITNLTDWTQHPDWATWLEEMRESVPRFVAMGTSFDNKTRRAIADWADECGLIWGAES